MCLLRFCFSAVLLLFLLPAAAWADCDGAVILGRLHDAYQATLTETGANRRNAAMSLLVTIGGKRGHGFAMRAAQSGLTVPGGHLQQVLLDAEDLATRVLTDGKPGDPNFLHGRNIRWLADVYSASGCGMNLATASLGSARTGTAGSDGAAVPGRTVRSKTTSLWILAAVAVALVVGVGIYLLQSSFTVRRMRAERQPRVPIAFRLSVSHSDPGGMRREEVESIDISLAGIKLAWPRPPSVGTEVQLDMPIGPRGGQVMWRNNLYAGIMFDNGLNQIEFQTLVLKTRPA